MIKHSEREGYNEPTPPDKRALSYHSRPERSKVFPGPFYGDRSSCLPVETDAKTAVMTGFDRKSAG